MEREHTSKRWMPSTPLQKILALIGLLGGLTLLTHLSGGFDAASEYLATKQAELEAEKARLEHELLDAAAEERPDLANYPKYDAQRRVSIYQRLVELRPENEQYRTQLTRHQAELRKIAQEEFVAEKARLLTERKEQERAAVTASRRQRIEQQFSGWDGSHRRLERYIKSRMNDPDSYQHVSTRFVDNSDSLLVTTTFRGKNAFGGMVINHVAAIVSLDGEVQEIVSWGQ